MVETIDRREDGFELDGEFYRWAVTDTGKDLLLVDSFARMPIVEFFETIEDAFDRGRAPILLAIVATSIRGKHPDWSVDRIIRKVQNTSLSDIVFVDADAEEQLVPPAEAGEEPASAEQPSASSPSLIPEDSS